ncbi:MAG: hypothetical protein HYW86_02465 [Candidatus Roizmanbacteria bacterium]|nr:MAG: hypothetical protein HYW86_02465 [Candidatus Roizmanbacteria bacterium]
MSKIEGGRALDPFSVVNPVRLLSDIPEPRELNNPGKKEAEELVELITQRLKRGETIVINDGSSDIVYGIHSIRKKIEVVEIHRDFPKDQLRISKNVINNYEICVDFFDGIKGKDLSIRLEEIVKSKPQRCVLYDINSAGPKRPRSFEIYANNEILLARSSQGSLTCAMEYRTPAVWYMNGNAFKKMK